jgi:RNA polymerase sigma-70 factor (ECF subfamily)
MPSPPPGIPDQQYMQVLFPYAYNILGSAEEARDAVQEVLVKHLAAPGTHITNPKNYLIRSVINLAITLKSRQKKTLRPGEHWLPEPVATDDAADRDLHLDDVLSYSLLVLMERLDARERAVFILRESFDYTHAEIAGLLAITEAHSRKLLSRARAGLFKPAPKRTAARDAHDRHALEGFLRAIRQRDTQQLETLMAADIGFYADGGGKVPLAAGTCTGAAPVAALLMRVYHTYLASARLVYTRINHQPALLSYVAGRLTACQVFDVHPERGTLLHINVVLDPEKLKSLSPPSFDSPLTA